MSKPKSTKELSISFRAYYGKLFAALLHQFGAIHVQDIEDVIQNTFLKALKTWKPGREPENKESWLFIVAKNDLVNQLKSVHSVPIPQQLEAAVSAPAACEDLRLKTILFVAQRTSLSRKARVVVVLRNVFGLHVTEISNATLMSVDAVQKLLTRSKKKLKEEGKGGDVMENRVPSGDELALVEELLHAVFTMGFDSFNEKSNRMVNEDLCFEALALAKLMYAVFDRVETSNLLALFCFHISRLAAKVRGGKLVPFMKQDRAKWDDSLIQLGFHYLTKPEVLCSSYLEALITSKHMTARSYDAVHWEEIVALYQQWYEFSNSPLVAINLAYALCLKGEKEQSRQLLLDLEARIPSGHLYFNLVKAKLLEMDEQTYHAVMEQTIEGIGQEIRKEYLRKIVQ